MTTLTLIMCSGAGPSMVTWKVSGEHSKMGLFFIQNFLMHAPNTEIVVFPLLSDYYSTHLYIIIYITNISIIRSSSARKQDFWIKVGLPLSPHKKRLLEGSTRISNGLSSGWWTAGVCRMAWLAEDGKSPPRLFLIKCRT